MHAPQQPRHLTPKQATVLVLANHKGGCGKTTTTANLGAALAARHQRVLLIDADPQANLSEAFGITPEHPGPRLEHALANPHVLAHPWTTRDDRELANGIHLIPTSSDLEATITRGFTDPTFAHRLHNLIEPLKTHYDAILIDTPPGLGPLSSMAMLAGDYVLVPARPADFDVGGAVKLADLVEHDLHDLNPNLRLLGVLVTQVDRRWTLAQETREALQAAGVRKLRTEIPFRVRVGGAPRHGAPTTALEPDGVVGLAYDQLAADLINTVLR